MKCIQTHHDRGVDQHALLWLDEQHDEHSQDHEQRMKLRVERQNVPNLLSMMVHMVHKHDHP